jgi:Tfp pilus assembly protein PilE
MNKQQGATLFGMMIIAMVVVFAAILVMKILPPYMDFWTVQKVLSAMAHDPEVKSMSEREVRMSFDRRASIDNIKSVSGSDLDISKQGGEVVVEVSYPVKVKLFGNLSACMDFSASTAGSTPAGAAAP